MRSICLALLLCFSGLAAAAESSGFGEVAIPAPARPAAAENCVEPVEVMRREHMNFLLHQRDETVIDGERGSKYSLTGCMDCHNPASEGKVVRYEDPQHFCAECHAYTGISIDCFECHADRGLQRVDQSALDPLPAWWQQAGELTAISHRRQPEPVDAD